MDTSATTPPASAPPPPESGWQRLGGVALEALPALVGAVGFLGFIALIGGAIQWTRFSAAELPADQAVQVIPRSELVTIGAVTTILFTLAGLAALLLVYLLDRRGSPGARTRIGLLIVVALELGVTLFFISLRPLEYVLLVGWILLVTGLWARAVVTAQYRLIDRLRIGLGSLLDERRKERATDDEVYAREQERFRVARDRYGDASDAWAVAEARPRPDAELEAARVAWRRAQDAWDIAERRWGRVQDEHRSHRHGDGHPDEAPERAAKEPLPSLRPTPIGIAAFGVLAIGLVITFLYEETRWLVPVLLVPVVLYVALLGIARATSRFAWYGAAVFLSVPLFGGLLTIADNRQTPQLQPVALVRKSDDHAMCGVYITQTSDRLYVGRVERKSDSSRLARPRSGRIFSVPMKDVDVVSVGDLQPIAQAERHALALLAEIYVDRAEEAPAALKNTVAVVERQRQQTGEASAGAPITTRKRTTTSEAAPEAARPIRREPPADGPPESCASVSLD